MTEAPSGQPYLLCERALAHISRFDAPREERNKALYRRMHRAGGDCLTYQSHQRLFHKSHPVIRTHQLGWMRHTK
ncbi:MULTISPECIES: hypothetical protein [unclassified Myxococcus]|uniref:hypothetical protein n=1 Tax=unclassified Myxococcus TaxID=2648731 RepID=UPI001E565CFD|nr:MULTISPECIES: hypothetical protein [unclassified Myxococcus]